MSDSYTRSASINFEGIEELMQHQPAQQHQDESQSSHLQHQESSQLTQQQLPIEEILQQPVAQPETAQPEPQQPHHHTATKSEEHVEPSEAATPKVALGFTTTITESITSAPVTESPKAVPHGSTAATVVVDSVIDEAFLLTPSAAADTPKVVQWIVPAQASTPISEAIAAPVETTIIATEVTMTDEIVESPLAATVTPATATEVSTQPIDVSPFAPTATITEALAAAIVDAPTESPRVEVVAAIPLPQDDEEVVDSHPHSHSDSHLQVNPSILEEVGLPHALVAEVPAIIPLAPEVSVDKKEQVEESIADDYDDDSLESLSPPPPPPTVVVAPAPVAERPPSFLRAQSILDTTGIQSVIAASTSPPVNHTKLSSVVDEEDMNESLSDEEKYESEEEEVDTPKKEDAEEEEYYSDVHDDDGVIADETPDISQAQTSDKSEVSDPQTSSTESRTPLKQASPKAAASSPPTRITLTRAPSVAITAKTSAPAKSLPLLAPVERKRSKQTVVRASPPPARSGSSADSIPPATSTSITPASTSTTILDSLFPILLQDPLSPSTLQPLLSGLILPTTIVFRHGKSAAVYYTDSAGYVRYHAWNASADKKAFQQHTHFEQAVLGPPYTLPGRENLTPTRAINTRQSLPLVSMFHPCNRGIASSASSSSSLSPFHPKSIETSIRSVDEIIRMFLPVTKSVQTGFLKRQKRKGELSSSNKKKSTSSAITVETTDDQQQPSRPPTIQVGDEDEEEDYAADEMYHDDEDFPAASDENDTNSTVTSTASTHTRADSISQKAQYLTAYNHARVNRGYINIEDWKREERALMRARQKTQRDREKRMMKEQQERELQELIQQEQMYVGLLIFTVAHSHTNSSEPSQPLPPPVAITLGQLRSLLGVQVLSPSSLPTNFPTSLTSSHDFVVQHLEYCPGEKMQTYRVVYDERVSLTQIEVWKCVNQTSSSASNEAGEERKPLSHDGFRKEEICYTYKSPNGAAIASSASTEIGPLKYDETHRRFKKIMISLIRRIQESTQSVHTRPTYLQAYFQQGITLPNGAGVSVAAASDVSAPSTSTTNLSPLPGSNSDAQPGEVRRKPWFFLYADALELGVAHEDMYGGSSSASSIPAPYHVPQAPPGHYLDIATQLTLLSPTSVIGAHHQHPTPAKSPKFSYPVDQTSGQVIVPGIHAYSSTQAVQNVSTTVDKSQCIKCHSKTLQSTDSNLIMLKQVLLKWIPNQLYEYPEDLFRDILGVDENPTNANWHRSLVNVCRHCLDEMRALKTIPNRTQLAPWLASISVDSASVVSNNANSSVASSLLLNPTASAYIDNPQVKSCTLVSGANVVINTKGTPSLLPYLSRAPILHSSGSGHSHELIPRVAFIPKKHNSLLETQGITGPQGGLAINPRIEAEGNSGGLPNANLPHTQPLQAGNVHPLKMVQSHSASSLHANGSAAAASASSSSSSLLKAPSLSHASSVPTLLTRTLRPDRVRGSVSTSPSNLISRIVLDEDRTHFGKSHLVNNKNGKYVMESAYIHETLLNPHDHPTHLLVEPVKGLGDNSLKKGLATPNLLLSPSNASAMLVGRSKSPMNLAAVTAGGKTPKSMLQHSNSMPGLGSSGTSGLLRTNTVSSVIAQKSSVAGGAGCAPSLPHRPHAPTILLAPVKKWGHTLVKSNSNKKESVGPAQKENRQPQQQKKHKKSSSTTLATVASKSSPQQLVKLNNLAKLNNVTRESNSAPKASEAAKQEEDEYDDEDEFNTTVDHVDTEEEKTQVTTSTFPTQQQQQQPWWDEVKQQWSYEAYPTDYSPVVYDPAQHGGSALDAVKTGAKETEHKTETTPVVVSIITEQKSMYQAVADAFVDDDIEDEIPDHVADEKSSSPTAPIPVVAPIKQPIHRLNDEDEEYAEEDF